MAWTMGVLFRQSNQQRPCAICGKDAFTERQKDRWVALRCPDCSLLCCLPCAHVRNDEGIAQSVCPTCKRRGMPVYLNPSLMPNSVYTMPMQTLDGWPEVSESVYLVMISEVRRNLPVLIATLTDVIPQQLMPVVMERLCFGISTGKYLEWCYSRQQDARAYMHSMKSPDFEAPSLPKMADMICALIAEDAQLTTSMVILEGNARQSAEMLAVLTETYPDIEVAVYHDAPSFIALMKMHLRWMNLVCLDHDLEPPADGPQRNMGDGRDAVRWLIAQPHKVPVLIHTMNSRCGTEMENALKDAGWDVHWSPPYDDVAWIRKAWIRRVGEMLGRVRC